MANKIKNTHCCKALEAVVGSRRRIRRVVMRAKTSSDYGIRKGWRKIYGVQNLLVLSIDTLVICVAGREAPSDPVQGTYGSLWPRSPGSGQTHDIMSHSDEICVCDFYFCFTNNVAKFLLCKVFYQQIPLFCFEVWAKPECLHAVLFCLFNGKKLLGKIMSWQFS